MQEGNLEDIILVNRRACSTEAKNSPDKDRSSQATDTEVFELTTSWSRHGDAGVPADILAAPAQWTEEWQR